MASTPLLFLAAALLGDGLRLKTTNGSKSGRHTGGRGQRVAPIDSDKYCGLRDRIAAVMSEVGRS